MRGRRISPPPSLLSWFWVALVLEAVDLHFCLFMNEACLCFGVLFLENTPLHLVSCLAYCMSAYLHTGTYILMCIYELDFSRVTGSFAFWVPLLL